MRSRKKTKMKISVVIPVKKATGNLKRCLESIFDQTVCGHEVIMVDGSRSDRVEKIARGLKNRSSNLRYIREEFFSMGSLKNRGIMVSNGDIILMTGADCEVPRDWIQNMVRPITEGTDIVQGRVSFSPGKFWSRTYQRSDDRLVDDLSSGDLIDHIDSRNSAFRKEVLIAAGMYDRHIRDMEDLHLKIRMKRYGFIIHYLDTVNVIQHRKIRLNDIFWESVEKGRWINFIYSMEQGRIGTDEEIMFRLLRFRENILFLPSLVIVLLRKGPPGFISELITGTGIRIGSLAGSYRRKRFLRSIRTRYY